MQTIETGYKPEFALGALYAGQNAANAQDFNNEELSKLFLANQREQQMQPLDIQKAQWDAASAMDKYNNPEYRDAMIRGAIGTANTQEVNGNTAKVLEPFKIANEKLDLTNKNDAAQAQWTLNDIDRQLLAGGGSDDKGNVIPFTPQQKQFMVAKREELANQIMNSGEFLGKKELEQLKLRSNELIARGHDEARVAAARRTLSDPKYKEQLARAMSIVADPAADPSDRAKAAAFIEQHKQIMLASNPASYAPQIDYNALGIQTTPAPIKQVPATPVAPVPQPAPAQPAAQPAGLPQGWSIKPSSNVKNIPK